jgi:hypothetical protein
MKADLQKFSPLFTHVPFTVLLGKLLAAWRKDHDGQVPQTEEDKKKFSESIIALGKSQRSTLLILFQAVVFPPPIISERL